MTLEQLINQKVQQLPLTLQMEVLHFVEFLESKQAINPQSKSEGEIMQSVKIPPSVSYEDFIIEKLQNPEHAAGFITAILEEENPEPELLRNALSKVITAYQQQQTLSPSAEDYYTQLEEILSQTGGQEIYTFIQLLNGLELQLSVEVSNQS